MGPQSDKHDKGGGLMNEVQDEKRNVFGISRIE